MTSILSAFPFIGEQSFATPGAFNSPLSIISANIAAINTDVGAISGMTISPPSGNTIQMPSDLSISGYLSVGKGVSIGTQAPSIAEPVALTIGVNSGISDYLYFNDTSNLRSDYLIGSHAGGTADGLNIFDVSGNTMIVSFSKQSVRFYQQVVGPVFDVGGALADTLNAATFGTGADSDESRIQAAISAAITAVPIISRIYLPASMYPYSAASVSFDSRVQMVREGGNWDVCDVQAYGASPIQARDATAAIQGALVAGNHQGRVAYVPAGNYNVSVLSYYSSTILRGTGAAGNTASQLYQPSGAGIMLTPAVPGSPTANFLIEDLLISASGNAANSGGIDCTNCVTFSIRRVKVVGMANYGMRVTGGPVAGNAGFGTIDGCQFTDMQGAATNFLMIGTATDQPDGMLFINNYMSSNHTWIASLSSFDRGVNTFVCANNRFEGDAAIVSAITGRFSGSKFIGNRFEVTSSGTIRVGLNPQVIAGTQLCGVFIGNTWAAAGGVLWNDNGVVRSPRVLEDETGGILRNEWGDGTAINPAFSFRSDTSLGFYRSGLSAVGLSYGQLQLPAGTALQPSLAVSSESSLGFYRSAASSMALSYGTLDLPLGSQLNLAGGGSMWARLFESGGIYSLTFNKNRAGSQDNTLNASWVLSATINAGVNDAMLYTHIPPGGGSSTLASLDSLGNWNVGAGTAVKPAIGFLSDASLGWYRSTASTMALSYGQLSLTSGSNTTPSLGWGSTLSLGFYSSGVQTVAQSFGTFNLATNAVRLSMRTIAASALTASAANTNVAVNEVVFTVSASGASYAINSGGTTWIFNSDASAKNT